MPGDARTQCPGNAAGGGKTLPQNHAPLPAWPKPGHPFYRELRLDRNYVWDRMMASVSPTKSQLSREVPYES